VTFNVLNGTYTEQVQITADGTATNTITFQSSSGNQYYRGIVVRTQDSPIVTGNTVTTNSAFNDFFAVRAEDCDNTLERSKNHINLSQGTGIHVRNGIGTSSNTGLVANNFVRVANGNSVTAIGIEIENTTYLNVYHNTVSTNSSSASFARAFWAWGATGTNNNVVDNIFSCTNANGYAYYLMSGTAGAITNANYNNLNGGSSKFSHWDGTNYSSLPLFQTASGTDANSVSTPVTFTDAANGDLHLSGTSDGDLTLIGTPLAAVTDDIDGDLRNPATPYMGADQAGTTLPVELTSFSYSIVGNSVELSWHTATETNHFGFEIQRKQDGSAWHKIGFAQGHGTTLQPQAYRFVDAGVSQGVYFYRRKQIDTDGSIDFSPTLMASLTPPTTFELSQNYPTPFNPSTSINYSVAEDAQVKLTIFNVLGKSIHTLVDERKTAGTYSLIWNGKDGSGQAVPSGAYLYELKVDGKAAVVRTILLLK